MFKTFSCAVIVAFCLVFSIANPAKTQEGVQQAVSDEQLEKAAKAYLEITKISNEFQQSVQAAPDQDARMKLQREANEKMVEAVKAEDLEVEKYNNIMDHVRNDGALLSKFTEKLQALN